MAIGGSFEQIHYSLVQCFQLFSQISKSRIFHKRQFTYICSVQKISENRKNLFGLSAINETSTLLNPSTFEGWRFWGSGVAVSSRGSVLSASWGHGLFWLVWAFRAVYSFLHFDRTRESVPHVCFPFTMLNVLRVQFAPFPSFTHNFMK